MKCPLIASTLASMIRSGDVTDFPSFAFVRVQQQRPGGRFFTLLNYDARQRSTAFSRQRIFLFFGIFGQMTLRRPGSAMFVKNKAVFDVAEPLKLLKLLSR
jgi:hypothetical protein